MAKWLKDAIFYEIYPTSFYDSNGDGIGDLKGIQQKLDYVESLGVNAIWLNPFFKSPFKDGGYDVSDFKDVDPRFGTMKDFEDLLEAAHKRNIRIIIDLVAGHASEENKYFIESGKAERNEYSDLFIWNNNVWELPPYYRMIAGRYDRFGCYMVNFFFTQPAFNYGWNKIEYPEWQIPFGDKRTEPAKNFLKSVMRFWLQKGVDGFRVDMADSLVKGDDDKTKTMELWREFKRDVFEKDYPEAVLVSEWSNPKRSLACGFDADFVLDHWDNCFHRLVRSTESTRGKAVLNGGDFSFFKKDLLERIDDANQNNGYLAFISGNHDTPRIASFLDKKPLRIFYMMLYTLPGTPFLYYGDEIGMVHRDLPSKDGGYQRTGDRTPMQWSDEPQRGFSTSKELYLPVGDDEASVASQEQNPKSLLIYIRRLIAIRNNNEELRSRDFQLEICDDASKIIAYRRGTIRVVINLSSVDYKLQDVKEILAINGCEHCCLDLDQMALKPNSSVIYRLK